MQKSVKHLLGFRFFRFTTKHNNWAQAICSISVIKTMHSQSLFQTFPILYSSKSLICFLKIQLQRNAAKESCGSAGIIRPPAQFPQMCVMNTAALEQCRNQTEQASLITDPPLTSSTTFLKSCIRETPTLLTDADSRTKC